MRRIARVVVVLVTFIVPLTVNAGPITVAFSGEIDFVRFFTDDPFNGRISVGTRLGGIYRYDGDAEDLATNPAATGGVYLSEGIGFGFLIAVDGIFGSSFGLDSSLLYRTDNRFEDVIDIQTTDLVFGGLSAYLTQINLVDSTGTALSSKELPQGAPIVSDWDADRRTFFLGLGTQNDPIAIYQGTLTRMATVSEPGTLALFAIGLFGLLFLRRKQFTVRDI